MDQEDGFMMPINIGHECQMLMHNNDQLKRCQLEAFDSWIEPWKRVTQFSENGRTNLPTKYNCCYRWTMLDCLTESVQDFCPEAGTFDLRLFLSKRDQVVLYYETFLCKDYPFGSLLCHLPVWSFILVLFSLIVLFLLIGFLVFYNVRFYRGKGRHGRSDNVTDL